MSLERYVSILDLWRLRLAGVGEVVEVTPLHPAAPSQRSAGGSEGPRSELLPSDTAAAALRDDEAERACSASDCSDALPTNTKVSPASTREGLTPARNVP